MAMRKVCIHLDRLLRSLCNYRAWVLSILRELRRSGNIWPWTHTLKHVKALRISDKLVDMVDFRMHQDRPYESLKFESVVGTEIGGRSDGTVLQCPSSSGTVGSRKKRVNWACYGSIHEL